MGLRADLQADLAAEMADADALADTVEAFTAKRVTVSGTLDPVTGQYTESTETWSATWICDSWTRQELDSQHINATDIKRIVIQSDTAWRPRPDDTVGGFYVVDADQDGAQATWIIQLREAS